MKHIQSSHALSDMVTLFASLPMQYQPYHFYDGLVFHTRKSLVNPDKCFLYLENDLGVHYLGIVSKEAENVCFEILQFMTEVKKGLSHVE